MTGGLCKPGFERVAEAFEKNFEAHGEVGASVCLTVGGETVVDLWGVDAAYLSLGYKDKAGGVWAR